MSQFYQQPTAKASFSNTATTRGPQQPVTDREGTSSDWRPFRCGGVLIADASMSTRLKSSRTHHCLLWTTKIAHSKGRDHTMAAQKVCTDQTQPTHQFVVLRRYRTGAPRPWSLPSDQNPGHTSASQLCSRYSRPRRAQPHRRLPAPEANRASGGKQRGWCRCCVVWRHSSSPQTPCKATKPHAPRFDDGVPVDCHRIVMDSFCPAERVHIHCRA